MRSKSEGTSSNVRNNSSDDLMAVITAAAELGKRKQHVFKVLKRLRIETTKERSSVHNGQAIAFITKRDFNRLREHFDGQDHPADEGHRANEENPTEQGWFYLIQLEPDHDPGRFKVGFANNFGERMRHLRCSAPLAQLVHKWCCRRLWEKTAIDCVTAGCEQLHTEVFRSDSIVSIRERCEGFFKLMAPALKGS